MEAKFKTGDVVRCLFRDQGQRIARVGSTRVSADGQTEYYVRFAGLDKRHDAWVSSDRITIGDADDHIIVEQEEAKAAASHGAHGARSTELRLTDTKNIQEVVFGEYRLSPWYFSPYPDEFGSAEQLFVCPRCLDYLKSARTYSIHLAHCSCAHPPGDEIWIDGAGGDTPADETLSFFEVDGRLQKPYCQRLCLLSRLFLEHKTLHYDVEAFLFYCLCRRTRHGYVLLGYFSKEKQSPNTLACILTLPQHQKRGYARLLMDMAYALCRMECRYGGPEEPLSDLGAVSFRAYWKEELLRHIFLASKNQEEITIRQCVRATGIQETHVRQALIDANVLRHCPNYGYMISLWEEETLALIKAKFDKANNRRRVRAEQICWRPLPSMQIPLDQQFR